MHLKLRLNARNGSNEDLFYGASHFGLPLITATLNGTTVAKFWENRRLHFLGQKMIDLYYTAGRCR